MTPVGGGDAEVPGPGAYVAAPRAAGPDGGARGGGAVGSTARGPAVAVGAGLSFNEDGVDDGVSTSASRSTRTGTTRAGTPPSGKRARGGGGRPPAGSPLPGGGRMAPAAAPAVPSAAGAAGFVTGCATLGGGTPAPEPGDALTPPGAPGTAGAAWDIGDQETARPQWPPTPSPCTERIGDLKI